MAHIHKKVKNGKDYYYIREMARVNGKPKVVNQVYLGSIERILEMAAGGGAKNLEQIQVQEFGALWLANLIEREIGLVSIIDSVIPKGANETGPSVGEYFLYAAFNRMVDACSKRALPEWYKGTAIQHIRPVDIEALDSDGFWKKWEKADEADIALIAQKFLAKIAEIEPPSSDCFLFDTTNYYTFMAGQTASDLAKRGKKKEGRDWLRQVGLALLVSGGTRLPAFYKEYEGNCHDSTLFNRVLDDVLCAMKGRGFDEVTIIFDKGINSEDNIGKIDETPNAHFVTTYSTYFAEEFIHVPKKNFGPVDTPKNRELKEKGREDDSVVAWRTKGLYWGRERTVVVTYNPLTASKQRYAFERRLAKLTAALFEFRSKVRSRAAQWRKKEKILERYNTLCEDLNLPKDLYDLDFESEGGQLGMSFRKNHYRISRHIDRFGKNIIITDRTDWTTDKIVQANLDRYQVEDAFRLSKDDDLVSLFPIRHWTDSKIRCHIFSCIAALCYLRIIELRLHRAGLDMTAATAMKHMQRLHSCLCWQSGAKKPARIIETPSDSQAAILRAFRHETAGGVLQKIKL